MKYDFDTEIDRRNTNSVKWSFLQEGEDLLHWEHTDRFFGENRILPMWVADMDFRCPQPVVDAVTARARHGIYGYTDKTASYYQTVATWMKKRHGWEIDPQWISTAPGVVPALSMLVRTFTSPGDKVLVQTPVYYPFFSAIEKNGGVLTASHLINEGGRYRMDYDDLAEKTADPKVTMFILCSPHNPVSRVWSREELLRCGEICLANDVLIVVDEIHGDLIFKGHTFTPFATISEAFAQHSIICTAPSKTFNLAGLQTSNIVIANDELRSRFQETLSANGLFGINPFGLVALEAAYNDGEEWLEQVLEYLEDNLRLLESYVAREIPEISVIHPEGTYLVWLDCRSLGLGKWELKKLMLQGAGVYFDEGFIFGPDGEGFERINIACPRSILEEALGRIKRAVRTLGSGRTVDPEEMIVG